MVNITDSKPFVIIRTSKTVFIRMLCIPYAGGGVNVFSNWSQYLPDYLEIVAVQLPGRGARLFETSHQTMDEIVKEIADGLLYMQDLPFIIFGHSLGGCIGFALLDELSNRGMKLPVGFIASASRPPHMPTTGVKASTLSDSQFIKLLRGNYGIPTEILESIELMNLLMPMLRADFSIAEDWKYRGNLKFDIPLIIFVGRADFSVTIEKMLFWKNFFYSPPEIYYFSGGHMFINTERIQIGLVIEKILSELL